MSTPVGYIDLDRRFSMLHGTRGVDDVAESSYLRGSFAASVLGWDELLNHRLVVVLGEPGSGKSWEFRNRCASLKEAGKPAFLVELEPLASGAFESSFSPADLAHFQQWQGSRNTAWFFLDSVDEAKIRRQADFYAAFGKVVSAIGPTVIQRAHIFISSRISEWQPETDRHEVLSCLGVARRPGSPGEDKHLLVVQIEPLDSVRVRTFAERRGIANPGRFVEELDNRFAWEFARRPLDVLDLAEYWSANSRLGTLTEIIEHAVTTKQRLLTAWIDRNKDRQEVWTRYSADALRRLAEPRLAPDIARFLNNGNVTSANVRELLVHLVRHGRLVECVPNLVAILGNPTESGSVRFYALVALRDVGTPESHQDAWETLRTMPAFPARLMCSVACETLYPNTIDASELAMLLEKPCLEKENIRNLQHTLERHLEEHLTSERAATLIRELNRLVQLPPHIKMSSKETRISVRFKFLLGILPLVLTRVLSSVTLTEAQCGMAAESLSLLAESRPFRGSRSDHLDSLDGVTGAHPGVRRCFFWLLANCGPIAGCQWRPPSTLPTNARVPLRHTANRA